MAQPPSIPKAASTPAKVPTIGFEVEEEEPEEPVVEPVEPAVGPFVTDEDAAELMFLQAFQNVKPELPDNRTTPRVGATANEMDLGRRANIARDSLAAERPEMAGYIDEAWRSASKRISAGDYKSAQDLEKNYFADAEADREKNKDLMRRLKGASIQYVINAKTNTGREIVIPRTGTALDSEVASLYPEGSIQHQLLTADIDPEDPLWSRFQMGSEDTPANRASIADIGKTKDPEFVVGDLQNLFSPVKSKGVPGWTTGSGGDLAEVQKKAPRRLDVYVNLYEDPRQGEAFSNIAAFDLTTTRNKLQNAYFQVESGGQDRVTLRERLIKEFNEAGPPAEGEVGPQLTAEQFAEEQINKIDRIALQKATEDMQRVKAQFEGNYTYNRDTESIAKYIAGETYKTKIPGLDIEGPALVDVPVAGSIGAMTLPLRAIEGFIETPDGELVTMSEGGGIEFISDVIGGGPAEEHLEMGLSRTADDLQRIALSTYISAPFWMAYKDWINVRDPSIGKEKGEDSVEGRRAYIFKRALEIYNSDRMYTALATQYDPAGRMMMDGGRILLGTEWGENNPTKANLMFGIPMFIGMLAEPDALQAALVVSGATLGGLGSIPGIMAGAAGGYGAGFINKGTKMARKLTTLKNRAERFADSATSVEKAFNNAGGRNMTGDQAVEVLRSLQEQDQSGITSQVVSRISERVAAKRNAPFTTDFSQNVTSELTHMHDAANQAATAVDKATSQLPQLRSTRAADRLRREAVIKQVETVSGLTVKQQALTSEYLIASGALRLQTDKVASLKQAQSLLTDDAGKAMDSILTRPITPEEASQFSQARRNALFELQLEADKIQKGKRSHKDFYNKLEEYQENFGAYDNSLSVRIEVEKGLLQEAQDAHKAAGERLNNSLRDDPTKVAYRDAEKLYDAIRQSDAENADEFIEAYTKLMNEELGKLDDAVAKASSDIADVERRDKLAQAVVDAVEQKTLMPKTMSGQTDVVDIIADTIEEFAAAARAGASVEGKPLADSLAAKGKTTAELVRDHSDEVDALIDVVRGEQGPLAVLAAQSENGRNLVLGMVMDARAGGLTIESIESANRRRLAMMQRFGPSFWGDEASGVGRTYETLSDRYSGMPGRLAWDYLTDPGLAMLRFTTTFSGLIRNSNIFTTDVSFLGDRFVPQLQQVANDQKRESDNWFREVGIIARFYGQKSPEAARSAVRTYLTTQQKITLPDEEGLIRTGYSVGGNQGFGDPSDSLFDFAIQNFMGVGNTFRAAPDNADDLAVFQADKSQALQALVKAFVADNINTGDIPKVNQAITAVGLALNKVNPESGLKFGDQIRQLSDPEEKINTLSDLIITELLNQRKKLDSGIGDPERPFVDGFRTLEDGTRVAGVKAEQKLYQVIMAGAHEWLWALGANDAVGSRLNIRQAGALEAYTSKDKNLRRTRTTIELGDRVVPKAQAEDFIMVMKGEVKGVPDEDAFKPRDFGLKGPLAEETLPKIGYPESMEVIAIFKDDDGVNMARLRTNDGPAITVPLTEVTRTSPEYSSLDLIDGLMAHGVDLVKDRGVTKKKWYHLRDQWVQFQIHSYDEYGNARIVPQISLEEWSSNFKGLVKDLNVTMSEKATTMAGFDATAHLLNKATNWWRTAVMFGPLGLKAPAQFVTQALGDIEFIAREQGYSKAFQIGLMSIPSWVPGAGTTISKGIQEAAAEASKPFGKKAPSILNSFVNDVLSDVSTGVNEMRVYTTSKGNKVNVNPAQLRREMVKAGVFDGGLTGEDSNRVLYEAAKRVWDDGVKDHFDFGRNEPNALARWFEVIRDTMDTATSRTKMLVWMDLRYNQGMSIADAKRQMGRTVFNYDNSLSKLEAMSIAKLSAFYVYKKNAAAANLQAFVAPSNKGLAARARQLFWPSRYKRVKAYSQFTQQYGIDVRRDPAEEIEDPEEGIETIRTTAQIDRRTEFVSLPEYALDRFIGSNGPLPPAAQLIARNHGQDWTTFSIGGSSAIESLVGLNFLGDLYTLMSGVGASFFMPDVGVNYSTVKRNLADNFADQFFPAGKTIAEPAIRRFIGTPQFQVSSDGVKVNAREGAMLEFMGMYDTLRVKPGKDNTLRSDHWLMVNGLIDPINHMGGTFERGRLLATFAFGDVPMPRGLGDNVDTLATPEIQIQQYLDPYRKLPAFGPRVDSFLRYLNLVDADFFNSAKNYAWRLQEARDNVNKSIKALEEASARKVRRRAKKEAADEEEKK